MITVVDKYIETQPFRVLHKTQTIRTTANVDYFLDMGTGINVSIDVSIQDVDEGMIFIDQVCHNHKLFFEKDSGEQLPFHLKEVHCDSHKKK